jgi:hypothetical protein
MKLATLTLTTGLLLVPAFAFAQGVSDKSPGQEMQEKGSAKGTPGASGYSPGHEMLKKGSKKGTQGASGYAPGHTTTGSSVKDNDHDRDDVTRSKAK